MVFYIMHLHFLPSAGSLLIRALSQHKQLRKRKGCSQPNQACFHLPHRWGAVALPAALRVTPFALLPTIAPGCAHTSPSPTAGLLQGPWGSNVTWQPCTWELGQPGGANLCVQACGFPVYSSVSLLQLTPPAQRGEQSWLFSFLVS